METSICKAAEIPGGMALAVQVQRLFSRAAGEQVHDRN